MFIITNNTMTDYYILLYYICLPFLSCYHVDLELLDGSPRSCASFTQHTLSETMSRAVTTGILTANAGIFLCWQLSNNDIQLRRNLSRHFTVSSDGWWVLLTYIPLSKNDLYSLTSICEYWMACFDTWECTPWLPLYFSHKPWERRHE